MAGSIGNDELAFGRREIAIRHIDGDALFTFSSQSVCQQAEISSLQAFLLARRFNSLELVFKNALAIVQKPTNECALPVIHATRSGETEEGVLVHVFCCAHQK